MKKTKILGAILLVVGITACEKLKEKPSSGKITEMNFGFNINQQLNARTVNDKVMSDFIEFPSDPQMTNMNKGLYMYMEGMRHVFAENPDVLQNIVNKLKQTNKNTVIITNLLKYSGLCKTYFNDKLSLLCPEKPNGNDFTQSIASELMNYNGQTQYVPLMMLANACSSLGGLDANGEFRLALGTDAEESSNNGNENTLGTGKLIPAWKFKTNGNVELELLSEAEARNSQTPVFIFTPGYVINGIKPTSSKPGFQPDYVDVNDGDGGVYIINGGCVTAGNYGGGNGGSTSGTTGGNTGSGYNGSPTISGNLNHAGVNIGYHYEASGASQYYITYSEDPTDNFTPPVKNHAIKDIARNVVDCNCYTDLQNTSFFNNVTDNTVFFFVTFEYDWYASEKTIQVYSPLSGGSFTYANLGYRATLNSEIYQADFIKLGNSIPQSAVAASSNGFAYFNSVYGINGHAFSRY